MVKNRANILLITTALFIILCIVNVSALTLSDQGTDVVYESTGYAVASADITISIWDSISGGNMLYNYTFVGGIANGTWNIMLGEAPGPNLTLDYNTIYYKDYAVNGEDVDFKDNSGNTIERRIFQSPLGNVSWGYLNNVPEQFLDGIDGGSSYHNIVTVDKDGNGNYTTIQDAIDSITDANSTNRYVIEIYPGIYNENIITKSYVSLKGMGAWARDVQITSSTSPVIDMQGLDTTLDKIYIYSAPSLSDQTECVVKAVDGSKFIFDSIIQVEPSNSIACGLEFGNNTLAFLQRSALYYIATGTTVGANNIDAIKISSGISTYYIQQNFIKMYNFNDVDDNFNVIEEIGSGQSDGVIANNDIQEKNYVGGITGEHTIFRSNFTSYLTEGKHFTANIFHIDSLGSGGNGHIFNLDTPITGIDIFSSNNHYRVTGFDDNEFAHLSTDNLLSSNFDDIDAVESVVGNGTYEYVNSPSPGNLQISGAFLNQYERVITVDKRGGDFQTIQEAIDSITDADENNPYTVKVMPGIYEENISLKDWVDLEGTGGWQSIISGSITWNDIVNTDDGWSNLMLIAVDYDNLNTPHVITSEAGNHDIDSCYFYVSQDSYASHLFHITNGTTTLYNTELEYYETGDSVGGTSEHVLIHSNGESEIHIFNSEMSMNINDSNKEIIFILSDSGTSLGTTVLASEIKANIYNNNMNVTFFDLDSDSNNNYIQSNHIIFEGLNSTRSQLYKLSISGGIIHSTGNTFSSEGFDNNYFAQIISGADLKSTFDNIFADDGIDGDPADYELVSSITDGSLTVTGNINVGVGINQEMDLIKMKTGQAIEPVFRYDNDWFGFSALIWDYEGAEATFGVEATNDISQHIIASRDDTDFDSSQVTVLISSNETNATQSWTYGRFGSSNGDFEFQPDGSSVNSPLRLSYYNLALGLREGVYVSDIDTVIDENSNNSQLPTTLAVKNYVDAQTINGSSSVFDNWDKNESNDLLNSGNQIYNGVLNIEGNLLFNGTDIGNARYSSSTGLIEGGILTINSSNTSLIDISAGGGIYADYSNMSNIIIEEIEWDSQTFDPLLSGFRNKWIGIERTGMGTGQPLQEVSFTADQKREIIVLGRVWGDGDSVITNVGQYSTPAFNSEKTLEDLMDVLGSLNKDGNIYSGNPSGNMKLDRSAGTSFRFTSAFGTNPVSPNIRVTAQVSNISSYSYHLQGSTSTTTETDIQPNYYDLSGVKTSVPTGNWTIQRIYYFPGSTTHITYGQAYYPTKEDAEIGINIEEVSLNADILEGSVLRGWMLIKQGATNLTDQNYVKFIDTQSTTGASSSSATETDPIFTASDAYDIDISDINNWNNDLDTLGNISCSDTQIIQYNLTSASWVCVDKVTDTNCSVLGSCPNVVYTNTDQIDDIVNGTELDGVFSTTGILERTASSTYSTLSSTGTGNVVRTTTPTILTPVLTLDTSASITDQRISYSTVNDWIYVGDGTNADTFLPVNTKTDEYVCTYESTGTALECDTATTGTGDIVKATSPALTTPTVTGNVSVSGCIAFTTGGAICSNSTATWII